MCSKVFPIMTMSSMYTKNYVPLTSLKALSIIRWSVVGAFLGQKEYDCILSGLKMLNMQCILGMPRSLGFGENIHSYQKRGKNFALPNWSRISSITVKRCTC